MHAMSRLSIFLCGCMAALIARALGADVAFVGRPGWGHINAAASPDPARKFDQWHMSGDASTTVTYMKDASTPYAGALGLIEKNFSDNKIKPATDKDMPCQGKTGHVVEFATGPDNHKIVINRILVPDGAGVATITYSRPDGVAFDPDVQKAEAAYCSAGT